MNEFQKITIGTNIPSPCKDCQERHRACSDHCPKYKEWKAKRAEIEKNRRDYIKANYRPRKKWRDNYGSRKDPM